MNKKNLLVITDGFPDIKNDRYNCQFVYDYSSLIKDYFKNIYVISPQPIFPKFLSKIRLFKKYGRFSNFSNYSDGNIFVFYPKFLTLPLPFFRKKNYCFFRKSIEKCIKKNKLKFGLIHSHFLNPTGIASVLIKKDLNKKLIITLHGGDIYNWPHQSTKNLQKAKKVLKAADLITVPSAYLEKVVTDIDKSVRKKCFIFNNFTDFKKFKILDKVKCRKNLKLPSKSKIIINVSNLVKGKGHIDLLNAFTLAQQEFTDDILLIIIGYGDTEKKLEEETARLKISNKVLFPGPISNSKLPQWYSAADLFVFPSYQESFGIVQIEALACGLPVVAYANEGSKGVLQNKIGKLVPVGNRKKLAKVILEHLNTSESEKEKIKKREYAQKLFSRKSAREKLINIYRALP